MVGRGGLKRVETELEARWDHAQVFRETVPRLWSAIYAFSGGARSLTDDVVAEAFARALEHDREIREPQAWLFRTAFRLAGSELRRRRRDVALVESSIHMDSSTLEVLLAMRKLSPGQRDAAAPGLISVVAAPTSPDGTCAGIDASPLPDGWDGNLDRWHAVEDAIAPYFPSPGGMTCQRDLQTSIDVWRHALDANGFPSWKVVIDDANADWPCFNYDVNYNAMEVRIVHDTVS